VKNFPFFPRDTRRTWLNSADIPAHIDVTSTSGSCTVMVRFLVCHLWNKEVSKLVGQNGFVVPFGRFFQTFDTVVCHKLRRSLQHWHFAALFRANSNPNHFTALPLVRTNFQTAIILNKTPWPDPRANYAHRASANFLQRAGCRVVSAADPLMPLSRFSRAGL
jgi:hypothetical protein